MAVFWGVLIKGEWSLNYWISFRHLGNLEFRRGSAGKFQWNSRLWPEIMQRFSFLLISTLSSFWILFKIHCMIPKIINQKRQYVCSNKLWLGKNGQCILANTCWILKFTASKHLFLPFYQLLLFACSFPWPTPTTPHLFYSLSQCVPLRWPLRRVTWIGWEWGRHENRSGSFAKVFQLLFRMICSHNQM